MFPFYYIYKLYYAFYLQISYDNFLDFYYYRGNFYYYREFRYSKLILILY